MMKRKFDETDGSHMSIREWEKKWWKDLNPKCIGCQKVCWQSAKAEILSCPQYIKETT